MDPDELSPIKLIPTKRSRVTEPVIFSKCLICQNDKDEHMSTGSIAGVKRIVESAQVRQDNSSHYILPIQDNLVSMKTKIVYHRSCYKSYTSHISTKRASYNEPTPGCSQNVDTHSTTRSHLLKTDWKKCMFCQKVKYKNDKKLRRVMETSVCNMLVDAAMQREDEHMLHRLEHGKIDLIAVEAVYHHACRSAYTAARNIASAKKAPDIHSSADMNPHAVIFNKLIDTIQTDLFQNNRAFTITYLVEKAKSFTPDGVEGYRTDKLIAQLKAHYGDRISILTRRGQGRSNVVVSADVTLDDAIMVAEEFRQDVKMKAIE